MKKLTVMLFLALLVTACGTEPDSGTYPGMLASNSESSETGNDTSTQDAVTKEPAIDKDQDKSVKSQEDEKNALTISPEFNPDEIEEKNEVIPPEVPKDRTGVTIESFAKQLGSVSKADLKAEDMEFIKIDYEDVNGYDLVDYPGLVYKAVGKVYGEKDFELLEFKTEEDVKNFELRVKEVYKDELSKDPNYDLGYKVKGYLVIKVIFSDHKDFLKEQIEKTTP